MSKDVSVCWVELEKQAALMLSVVRNERHSVRGSKCYKEKKSEKHASDREIHETDLFQCHFDHFNGMPGHVTTVPLVQ